MIDILEQPNWIYINERRIRQTRKKWECCKVLQISNNNYYFVAFSMLYNNFCKLLLFAI